MTELEKFYCSFENEVRTRQFAEDQGESQEQSFTRLCLDLLANANETENAVLAYDEKGLGTKKQHKVNGFAISEDSETIDLFISVYERSELIELVDKQNVERAATRLTNFMTKVYFDNYESELPETSPVFEFAHQVNASNEIRENLIRVNAFILTNKQYRGEIPPYKDLGKFKMFFNVIDIEKIYNLSDDSKMPKELDLQSSGVLAPCLNVPVQAEEYDAYLTYFPGSYLAALYERLGFKLLEQNVRSFLQFRAGINRGIRDTVLRKPHMFFAYNNGISATADSIELDDTGLNIKKIVNLQIVNGGQTTATLFHVCKETEEYKKLLVPVKISVIKQRENSYEIVKSISKYANTQNKINDADLSANDPVLIEIEKLSRYMLTPVTLTDSQHYWFFDRISKQYDNLLSEKSKKGKSYKKVFERQNPKCCKFTKYELAKYYNSYSEEVAQNNRIVVGPHSVVDGNETNFRAFRDFVMHKLDVNKIFYEDLIAKAILFKQVDKLHGTKKSKNPPIGDMKQVMVPYSIALLRIATNGNLDLGKIWRNQSLSDALSKYMYDLMVKLNQFLKERSPRSNIIEWATKEDCWNVVKESFEIPDIKIIADDLASEKTLDDRYSSKDNDNRIPIDLYRRLVETIDSKVWQNISEWGKDSGCLLLADQNLAKNIAHKIKYGYSINERDIKKAYAIYEIVSVNHYDLIESNNNKSQNLLFDNNIIIKMLTWEKVTLVLESWQMKIVQNSFNNLFLSDLRIAELLVIQNKLEKHGFCL